MNDPKSLTHYLTVRENHISGVQSLYEFACDLIHKVNDAQDLNAFSEIFEQEVREQAEEIGSKIESGEHGQLAGAFIAVKDNILTRNKNSAAASSALKDFIAPMDAEVVEYLRKEDAIILGKTNCDEYAMGSASERSVYGKVKNPLDHERIPGGSSGGSAVAVAAGLCHAALGTDTGGSVRHPAAYCGTYALKPSYGAVSRYGAIAYAPTFDQIGPIAADCKTLSDVFSVLAAKSLRDCTYREVISKEKFNEIKPRFLFLNFEEKANYWDKQIKYIAKKLGLNKINQYKMKYEDKLLPLYHTLAMTEASSSMARYQNHFFGKNKNSCSTVYNYRSTELGAEVQRKILAGTAITVAKPQRYQNALLWRRKMSDLFNELLKDNDILVLPATPSEAIKAKDYKNFIELYNHDKYLIPANITGLPSMVFPLMKAENGMPLSVQLMTRKQHDHLLIKFAKIISGKEAN